MGGWTVAESKNFHFKGEFNPRPHGSGAIWFLIVLDIRQLDMGGASHCSMRLLHPGQCYLSVGGGDPRFGFQSQEKLPANATRQSVGTHNYIPHHKAEEVITKEARGFPIVFEG